MIAAILAFGLFGAPKPRACPQLHYVQCEDSRALAHDPGFRLALRDFLGRTRARYLHGDKPLYDQVLVLIAQPQRRAEAVGEDMRLFAGCRRSACAEKAAVIVGQRGIRAVGIIDYSRGDPGLDVIVRRSDGSAWAAREVLRQWASETVAAQAEHDHANTSLHEVRMRALDEEAAAASRPPL